MTRLAKGNRIIAGEVSRSVAEGDEDDMEPGIFASVSLVNANNFRPEVKALLTRLWHGLIPLTE